MAHSSFNPIRFTFSLLKSVFVGSRTALVEMSNHKLRSFLSILGVMLGVASLVTMLTLIGGIDVYLNERMVNWIGNVWFWESNDTSEENRISASRSPGMRLSDGEYLLANAPEVKHVDMEISRWGLIHLSGESENIMMRGFDQNTLELLKDQIQLRSGRWLTDEDFRDGSKNAVISWEIAQNFTDHSHTHSKDLLIGQTIDFRSNRFTIVGIYEPIHAGHRPWHLRRAVFIPLRTMQMYITGLDPNPGRLQVNVSDPTNVAQQARRVATVLKSRHRGVEDFEYRTAEWVDNVKSMLGNISVLMSIISVFSLLTGGLSIMNVMLSSISERIREIGVRKALGAKNIQIFIQFIAETTTLSFTGGMIGVLLGTGPLFFKEEIMSSTQGAIEPVLLPMHLFYTFLIITSVGILFGLYPALKASRMDPVDALRYE
ncbi:Macrolide export ATP-binding/permease protein MacB [Chitinispirillum alkaliphilum]|nr:Macrolide export ATP-binding/permease protein MacB [Chitinispirillum alkaliphilum]